MYRYFIFFTLSLISTTSLLKAGKFDILNADDEQLTSQLSSLKGKLNHAYGNEREYYQQKLEALETYLTNKKLPQTTIDEQTFKETMIESALTAYFEAHDKKPRKKSAAPKNNNNLEDSPYVDFLNYENNRYKYILNNNNNYNKTEEKEKKPIKPENKAKIVPQTIEITTDILEELMEEPTIQGWEYVNGEAFGGALIGIKDYRQRSISHTEPEILSDTNGDEDSQILLKRRPDLIDHFYVRYSMEGIKIPFYLFYIENL